MYLLAQEFLIFGINFPEQDPTRKEIYLFSVLVAVFGTLR
jgi:hypothetical protein